MEHEFSFWSLLLITGLAAFIPLLSKRLRPLGIPIVVGEIVAGMVIGKSGFNLVEHSPALDFLSVFGFTYLMFLSGLEIDFSIILSTRGEGGNGERTRNPLVAAGSIFIITLLISFGIANGLRTLGSVENPLFMALILGTTSLGIVSPVLKERGLTLTIYGQTVLLAALVADFATLLLISVLVAFMSSGGLTFDLLLILVLLGAFLSMARVGQVMLGIPRLRNLVEGLSHATAQIEVRGAFALMVAFIVLADSLGAEIILGAFLAGGIISLLSGHEGENQLRMKLEAIGFGFFIPIFFIMVGVDFNLPLLLSSPSMLLVVPILLAAAYIVKFVPALVLRLNFSWRETLAAGALLSSRLSLIIAASAIALELGAINQATNAAVVLVAIVTCTLSPILFNRILPSEKRDVREGVILVGLGQLPVMLAERLRQSGESVVLVSPDRFRVREMRERNLSVVNGNSENPDILEEAGAGTAATLIAASTRDDINREVSRLAHDKFRIPHRIALISDSEIAKQLTGEGVRVVQPQMASILALEGALHFPAAFDMLTDITDGVEIRDVFLSNPQLAGRPIRRVRLPGNALIIGLSRDGGVLVPHGNTVIQENDCLMLLGDPDDLRQAIAWLNPAGV